jgi:hypothetical protein
VLDQSFGLPQTGAGNANRSTRQLSVSQCQHAVILEMRAQFRLPAAKESLNGRKVPFHRW